MELSESSSGLTQGESEGPCLIVQDSQKEEHPQGTTHKQKMLWEMTALQGDPHLSPVLEHVKSSSLLEKDGGKKDAAITQEVDIAVATSSSSSTTAPPWNITKMPTLPPRAKDSHSSSSSAGSLYPHSSHDTSISSVPTLSSTSSSELIGQPKKPPSTTVGQGKSRSSIPSHQERRAKAMASQLPLVTAGSDITLSQEDMFSDTKADAGETSRHWLLGTPSETIASLRLSGQAVYANETSTSDDASVTVIPPSPEAYGPVPVVIGSTPTSEASVEEEPMDVSLEYTEDDPQIMSQDHLAVGGSHHGRESGSQHKMTRQEQIPSRTRQRHGSAGSEGSEEDEIQIPDWQLALNRKEEATAAPTEASYTSSHFSVEAHSSQQSSQSNQGQQQPESLAGQNLQQESASPDEESARSRPGSAKSPALLATDKGPTSGVQKDIESQTTRAKSTDVAINIELTEPQFSQDLFHPKVPDEELSATAEEALESTDQQRPTSQKDLQVHTVTLAQSQEGNDGMSEKATSDDWSLHLTQTQGETQSQGVYLSRKTPVSQTDKDLHKARAPAEDAQTNKNVVGEAVTVPCSQNSTKTPEKQPERIRTEKQPSEVCDNRLVGSKEDGGHWEESVPRESQSVDPSQLSSIGFHLSVPADSGLRPVTSRTPPADARMKARSTHQPRHSTPIIEESQSMDHGGTPTGVKGQPTSTLTLEEEVESQYQESSDLPRFHLEKPPDTAQLVKTAEESPSKRSNTVFTRVQETKTAAAPRKTCKQLLSNQASNGESEDPFAAPSSITKQASSRGQSSTNAEVETLGRPEADQDRVESVVDPELNPRLLAEKQQPDNLEDSSATISMVYNEGGEVANSIAQKDGKHQKAGRTNKQSNGAGNTRKKSGGRKRKKSSHNSEDNDMSSKEKKNISNNGNQQAKQPRLERDPYEWTESQSNKTPTPLKMRKGGTSNTPANLPRRRLHDQDAVHTSDATETGDFFLKRVPSGNSEGIRKSAGSSDKGQDNNAPKDSTPEKETGSRRSRRKQDTPPVVGEDGGDADHSQDSNGSQSSQSCSTSGKVVRQIKTTVIKITQVMKVVQERLVKDGMVVDVNINEVFGEPVREIITEEYFSPSASLSSSLTSGSLADVSSFGTSKSSSDTPSLQKTSSSSSSGSNLTKTSSISSISHADSSLGKTVLSSSSPSSNKTSPNTSKGSGTPGTPKMTRSVSFQDELSEHHKSLSESKTSATSKDASSKPTGVPSSSRTALARAHTMPSPPTEQRSSESLTSLRRAITEQGDGNKKKIRNKSIFLKTGGAPGKQGLRPRGLEDMPEHRERENRQMVSTKDNAKESEKAGGSRKSPQLRARQSRTSQRLDKGSSVDRLESQPLVPTLPATLPSTLPATLPTTLPTDPPAAGQRSSTSEQSKSSEGADTGHTSSRGAHILASPPQDPVSPGTEASHLQFSPGTRVFSKWLDNCYYAGKIVEPANDNKHVVLFDDGDTKRIHEKNIIIREWLSKGQSVLVTKDDDYSYPGVVVGYYNDIKSGDQGYAVETDMDQETQRYQRSKVILTKDQAASLVSSSSSGPGSATSSSDINLDNIVSGKRMRGRFLLSPGGSPRGRASSSGNNQSGAEKMPVSPSVQQADGTPRPTTKRKLISAGPGSSPSPKKRGRMTAAVPSPDFPPSTRRSPRKNPAASTSSRTSSRIPLPVDRDSAMGPLPSNRSLFKGLAFLITSRTEDKQKTLLVRSPSDSTDESTVEEEIKNISLDKSYATEQVQHGGGKVLANFDKSQITHYKVYLLSNSYARTTKYFQALAASIPCVSHIWLRDCINMNKIQDHKAYLLPAGIGLDDITILEQQPHRCILAGMHIFVVSRLAESQKAWRSILIAAGCQMVKKLPVQLMKKKEPTAIAFECDLIVTDQTCPKHITDKALKLHIPVVSSEWLMQTLINSFRFPYDHSYKFTWDWSGTR